MSCENDNALIAIIKSINQEVKKRIPNATEKSMCKKEHCPTLLNGFFILTYGRTRMLWHAIIMFLCGAGSISIL